MNHQRWFGLVLLLLLGACAGGHINRFADAPAGALQGLGSPSELLRQASFEDGSQVRYGTEYEPTLPVRRAHADITVPTTLVFAGAAGPPLDPAWAIYAFDLTAYDEEASIRMGWKIKPTGGSVWLALANWDANHWDFVATDPSEVALDSLTPYISASGKLLLAVVAVDAAQHQLRWLTIGDAPAPAAPRIYAAFPTSGQPSSPYTVSAQVTGTEPLTYAWDFGGGTTPNTETAPVPTVTMGAEGSYDAVLHVTNKYGTADFNFRINSALATWTTNLFGDAAKNRFVALDTTVDNHTYVAAEMEDERVSVFAFDGSGEPAWNRAYTGLPANRVTDIAMASPGSQSGGKMYVACYQDDGVAPGNAYIVCIELDGSIAWYLPIGQGIPDVDSIDADSLCATLAMPSGDSRVMLLASSDGAVQWAQDTAEASQYKYIAGGDLFQFDEGMYVVGDVDGKMSIARIKLDGTVPWAKQYSGSAIATDCCYRDGTTLAVTGILPYLPEQRWDSFFLDIRLDARIMGSEKIRTDPCRAAHVSCTDGFVFMTCTSPLPDITKIFLIYFQGEIVRSVQMEGFGGIVAGDGQQTRMKPPAMGDPPPPPEYFMFAGSGSTTDVSIVPFSATPEFWWPLVTELTLTMVDATLPQEALTITPEEVAYTVDSPAGLTDAMLVRASNLF